MRAVERSAPVVVLTGASSGIGHATALAWANRGNARLVLAARGRDNLEAVAESCRALGADVLVVPTDVSDASAVRALASAAVMRFGHIDVWINNVGVGVIGLFDKTPIEAHRRVVETNLIGHMNGAHTALGHFRRRGRGILINMVSIGGWAGTPYAAAYAASKFAVRGLSESLRAEMARFRDIHVCEVYPGFVDSPGMGHGANYTGRQVRPLPPLVNPRTVASVVVDLVDAPRPAVAVGNTALPIRMAHAAAPGLLGRWVMWGTERAIRRAGTAPITDGNLYEPSVDTGIDGGYAQPIGPTLLKGAAAFTAVVALGCMGWLALRSGGKSGMPR